MGENLIAEFKDELHRIADWWVANTLDEDYGGFVGEITVDGRRVREADKGIILHARILWFFSEACRFTGNNHYRTIADRAYQYVIDHFLDKEQGGVFWALDFTGKCVSNRKQTYAQAFAIYGLSAYYHLTDSQAALDLADEIFEIIETRAHDNHHLGYIEALDRNWQPLEDMRLSLKDLNAPKTMNTHLHILEAYTALHMAKPSTKTAVAIKKCLIYFSDFIIDHHIHHQRMFQSIDWKDLSDCYSYGHDIEASWLIWEAVNLIDDAEFKEKFKPIVLNLAYTTLNEGVGELGEVFDAFNFEKNTLLKERVWWVQAEALVGFYAANELSGDKHFYDAFLAVWSFIKTYHIDKLGGEWHWLSTLDKPQVGDCKVGFWKAPYHNGRAMMELCKRLAKSY